MIKYLGQGAQKVCFKIGNYVIKFPAFKRLGRRTRENINDFIYGMRNKEHFNKSGKTARIYFNFFHFFSVEEYCIPISERVFNLISKNRDSFRVRRCVGDFKAENFGYSRIQNNVVWVDFY